ncbi:hypothetical protein DPEC_G00145690 [Dallia pectoralis]|uniref:Uncharacterized protein n=1 Tax=Dallia pectoralis TaxID=75939 RepID=A0ACC2GPK3_DALPE|nr:hypothetical protein DPEC_G00145690 [Dallia pectoralis]
MWTWMKTTSTKPLKTLLLGFMCLKKMLQVMNQRTSELSFKASSYPPGLRCTFEIIQKIFMELDGGTLSNKALVLKKQALPVKGSKRLHCQPNSLVIPEGMYGCTIWINFVCLFDFTGQDLHGTA